MLNADGKTRCREFRWTYVSIVYSDTDYGNRGYEKLQEVATRYNICFSNPQSINAEVNDTKYDTVIQNLMNKSNARGSFTLEYR